MASFMNSMVAFLSVALPFGNATATEYWVGEYPAGWAMDFNYTTWASKRTFYVGDTLVFFYRVGEHNVFEVDEVGFKNCTIPNIEPLKSGHDAITLKDPGKKWYICGVSSHCNDREQKLAIDVLNTTAPEPAPGTNSGHGINFEYKILVASLGALALMFI